MKKLNALYVLIVIAIALLTSFSTSISLFMLDRGEIDNKIINISGKQRLLNQKIVKCLLIINYSDNVEEINLRYNELKQTIQDWEIIEKQLFKLVCTHDSLATYNTYKIDSLLNEVGVIKKRTFKKIKDLIVLYDKLPKQKNVFKDILNPLLFDEIKIADLTNKIIELFEEEAKRHIEDIKTVILTLFIILLIVLLLQALLIYRPASKKVDITIKQLDSAKHQLLELNQNLETTIKQRTEELQNLNVELECDIESRMETEKLLQKSENRYRKLLENATDAIVIGDINGYIIEINSKMEELTGFSNEELIGKHFSIFIPAEEMQVAKNSVEHLKLHGFFKVIDGKIKQKNGNIVPVDLSGNVIEVDNQQIVQTIIHNISEQKILKDNLVQISESQAAINSVLLLTLQTQKLDEILEKILNILLSLKWLSLESKGCIFLVENNPQELVLKVSKNLSNSLLSICAIVPFGRCLCGRAALRHEIVFSDCLDHTHENTYDGILSHGHYCIPILDNETLLGVINVYVKANHIKKDEDVSFLKAYASLVAKIIIHFKTESEIEKLNLNLIERNKELEQFAYITSHDLQEPLRSITSFVDKIKSECTGKMDSNFNVYFNFIIQSTTRMSNLIYSVLEYSRLGKNRQLNKVNCNDLLSDIMTDISAIINESKANVEYKDLPIINALPVEMKQLFQNLILNALKFKKKDITPEIKITAEKSDNFWLFAIQDNGIGINEKHQDKIFKIFQRLHDRSEYEGLGIGLAFCKKIVEFHNGKIWVESEIAQGSTFYFTIPNLEI